MHDRAAEPIGATTSPTAMATEIMILLNIDFRIARVRPHVEEKRSAPSGLTRVLALLGPGDHVYDYEHEMAYVALATDLSQLRKLSRL